jgi:hypothetical protein
MIPPATAAISSSVSTTKPHVPATLIIMLSPLWSPIHHGHAESAATVPGPLWDFARPANFLG